MLKFFLWLSRKYHDYKDSKALRVNIRSDWSYNKKGDKL